MDTKATYDHLMAECLYAWECFDPAYGSKVAKLKELGRSLGIRPAESMATLKKRFLTEYDCLDDSFDPEEDDEDLWCILKARRSRTICS